MDDASWIIPAIFGVIILVALITFVGHMIGEAAKTRRNRAYKSLDEHQRD